jgi:hypothetical protein
MEMIGFHDLIKHEPSLFKILGWSSISVTSLTMPKPIAKPLRLNPSQQYEHRT